MKTFFTLLTLICLYVANGQNEGIHIHHDTLYDSPDSLVVFVTVSYGEYTISEYKGAYTDFEEHSFRHGFLWLKKTHYRTRSISHKWDEVHYDEWREKYPGVKICREQQLIYVEPY